MPTRLYALGSNSHGQLGIGHHSDVNIPTPCQFIHSPLNFPKSTTNGDPGGNSAGADYLKISLDLRFNIRKVVAGGNHTIVLCDDGAVYAAGNRDALGQVVDLGLRDSRGHGLSSQDLDACFKRVMWWEDSDLLHTFTDVSSTWSASFFVVAPQIVDGYVVRLGRIYVCGKGEKGELGLGEGVIETKEPRQVAVFGFKDYPSPLVMETKAVPLIPGILAGIWSNVAYTVTCSTDGVHVYGWGSCRKGQLGESVRGEKVLWEPRSIAEEDIKQDANFDEMFMAAPGKDFMLLQGSSGRQDDRQRRWRLLGENRFLRSDGEEVKQLIADLSIPIPKAHSITKTSPLASWSNVYVLESGTQQLKALGRNDHGQLPPEELPPLRTMAAGSEHCVGVTSQGQAVTWGWGEHGNCGRKSDETGQGWSVLILPIAGRDRIVGVGAGCATTFIWTAER